MSCRAAGVRSHRGLQDTLRRGATGRACTSFPETTPFFRNILRSFNDKQVFLVDLQPLSAWSPFRASNMGDKLYRIASIYENGGEGVCRMVTEGEVGRIS